MNAAILLSIARGGLQLAGGALVAKGVVSANDLPGAIDSTMTWLGATASFMSFAWSFYTHRTAKGA